MLKQVMLSLLAFAVTCAPAVAKEGFFAGVGLDYVNIVGSDPVWNTIDPSGGVRFSAGYDLGWISLEGGLLVSRHGDSRQGWSAGDLFGASLDARLFLAGGEESTREYLLLGLGEYSFSQTDNAGVEWTLSGTGYCIGLGLEHFLSGRMAFDLRTAYRIIELDEAEAAGSTVPVSPAISGDTFTLGIGLSFHF